MIKKVLFTTSVFIFTAATCLADMGAGWGDNPMQRVNCSKAGVAYATALQLICGGQSSGVAYNQVLNQGINSRVSEYVVNEAINVRKQGECPSRMMSQYDFNKAAQDYSEKCNSQ